MYKKSTCFKCKKREENTKNTIMSKQNLVKFTMNKSIIRYIMTIALTNMLSSSTRLLQNWQNSSLFY